MSACIICGEDTEARYFLRRNWRTRKWTVVKKWQIGRGMCKTCADIDAQNGNIVKAMNEKGSDQS